MQIQLVDSPFRSHVEPSSRSDLPGSSQHGTGGRNQHASEFTAEDEDGTESMKQVRCDIKHQKGCADGHCNFSIMQLHMACLTYVTHHDPGGHPACHTLKMPSLEV